MDNILLWVGVLTCLAPTATFIGVNTAWFTSRQMLFSCALVSVLGGALGVMLTALPSLCAGACLGMVFSLLSEKILGNFCHSVLQKCLACFGISIVFAGVAWFCGFFALCVVLFIIVCCAIFDIYKNWKRKKQNIFKKESILRKQYNFDAINSGIKFIHKPNIYFLFLESIHSAHALQKVYGVSDTRIEDYLERNGFAVFRNTLSNQCHTVASLASLLYMDPEARSNTDIVPDAFVHLFNNDYEIQLFDISRYTFGNYLQYSKYNNISIPYWVALLYEYFCPLFAQSCFLRKIVKNIDVFNTDSNFVNVFSDVRKRLREQYIKPQCYLFRFGAYHMSVFDSWRQRKSFVKHYTAMYDKTFQQIQEAVAEILQWDKNACIMVMGDHGSHSWWRLWWEDADCNKAMRSQGVAPATICLDHAGILCAIKMPDAIALPEVPHISPGNFFRLVFQAFGGDKVALQFKRDITYSVDNAYIIARDGIPLTSWEAVSKGDGRDACLADANAHLVNGDLPTAIRTLESASQQLGQDASSLPVLCCLLVCAGRKEEAIHLLEKVVAENPQPWMNNVFLSLLATIYAVAPTAKGFERLVSHINMCDGREKLYGMRHLAAYHAMTGNLEEAYSCLSTMIFQQTPFKDLQGQQVACRYCAWYLDGLGRTEEAIRLLDAFIDTPPYPVDDRSCTLGAASDAAALSLRTRDWSRVEKRVRDILENFTIKCPSTLQLWLAGALEQQGKVDEAREILESLYLAVQDIPGFRAQLGLFYMRHNARSILHPEAKELAREYLAKTSKIIAPIFDTEWYVGHGESLVNPAALSPFEHFMHYWRSAGLDPNPYFNTIYNRIANNAVFNTGIDQLRYFMHCKPYEYPSPSLAFTPLVYMGQHPQVNWATTNPLAHFCANKE